jgi:DNA-binding beta-propeller fold protein YncE
MQVIDTKSLKVTATWPLPGCASPSGLAMDEANRRLFSVCDAKIMVVTDSDTGRQVARVEIGEGPDAAAFDVARGLIFSSNGQSGTLTVVHQESPDRYRVVANVATQESARTMALDPNTHKIYLAAAKFGPRPQPTADQPKPRPKMVDDTFTIIVVAPR